MIATTTLSTAQRAELNRQIEKTLCLSTGHITKDDSEILASMIIRGDDTPVQPLIVYDAIYGWLVHVELNDDADLEGEIAAALDAELSPAFTDLLALAARLRCSFLRLDRDSASLDWLPKFEW